ncbi:MAG: hypothetical protein HGA85_01265 [Nanoarchaeota archaeon]|nr:hypothetical protein [Nanoarchaeota archaeon]
MDICIIGLGAIGSFVAEGLAKERHTLTLVDRDYVEQKNLLNQHYAVSDIGKTKAGASAERLSKLTNVVALPIELTPETVVKIGNQDLVLGLTDNLYSRLVINDYAKKKGVKWLSGAASKSQGMIYATIEGYPCYCCIFGSKSGLGCDIGISDGFGKRFSGEILEEIKAMGSQNYTPELVTCTMASSQRVKVSHSHTCSACKGTYIYLNTPVFVQELCGKGVFQFRVPGLYQKIEGKRFPGVVHTGKAVVFEDGRVMVKARTREEAEEIIRSL